MKIHKRIWKNLSFLGHIKVCKVKAHQVQSTLSLVHKHWWNSSVVHPSQAPLISPDKRVEIPFIYLVRSDGFITITLQCVWSPFIHLVRSLIYGSNFKCWSLEGIWGATEWKMFSYPVRKLLDGTEMGDTEKHVNVTCSHTSILDFQNFSIWFHGSHHSFFFLLFFSPFFFLFSLSV